MTTETEPISERPLQLAGVIFLSSYYYYYCTVARYRIATASHCQTRLHTSIREETSLEDCRPQRRNVAIMRREKLGP